MKRLTFSLSLLLAISLGGCSSPSNVLPPLKLTSLTNEILIRHDWTRQINEGAGFAFLKLKPVIVGDRVYSVDKNGLVSLSKLSSGDVIWQKQLGLPVSSSLRLDNNALYLGTSKGQLIALSAENGSILWQQQLSSEILVTPAVADGVVVVRTVNGNVYGLSSTDGAKRWVYSREVPLLTLRGTSTPVISNGIALIGFDNGKMVALTINNGTQLWEATIAEPKGRTELERIIDIDIEPVVIDGVAYIASYQGKIAVVQIDSGRVHWARDMSSYSGLAVDSSNVYVTDADGVVWALNRFNGSTLWRQDKLLRRSLTAPTVHNDYVVVSDFNGYVHWLSRTDGHMVARKRVNQGKHVFEPEDSYDALFHRSENVLVPPMLAGNSLLVVDRMGLLSSFTIQ